jgi:hypothetical protein
VAQVTEYLPSKCEALSSNLDNRAPPPQKKGTALKGALLLTKKQELISPILMQTPLQSVLSPNQPGPSISHSLSSSSLEPSPTHICGPAAQPMRSFYSLCVGPCSPVPSSFYSQSKSGTFPPSGLCPRGCPPPPGSPAPSKASA